MYVFNFIEVGPTFCIPYSNQGLKCGSFVQTRDSSMDPLFKPETQAWVLCPNQRHNRGSFVQTKDPSVGPFFKRRTQVWILCSNQGPKRKSFFKRRTPVWILCSDQRLELGITVLIVMFTSFPLFYASQHLRNCGSMWSIAYKLWAHVEHCLQTVGPC